MNRKIYILLLLLFFVCNNSYSKSPPPGTGTSSVPANILIMLDNSGSMSWDINGVPISSWKKYVSQPSDVAVDSNGNIYALQMGNKKIKVFDSSGAYVKEIGTCSATYPTNLDIYNDTIYLIDYYNTSVKVLSTSGNCIKQKATGGYWSARSIAVSSSYIFVGGWHTYSKSFIRILDRNSLNQVDYHWSYPTYYAITGLDVNSDGTKLVTVSHYQHKICLHNISGTNLGSCQQVGNGSYGWSNGYFIYPIDAAFDYDGNIFVVDSSNRRLQKFNSSGTYVTKYGSYSYNAPFRWPWGVGVSSDNKVYVADQENNDIYEFNNNLTSYETIGVPRSRMSIAKEVIKKIVQDPELTSGANFGLMEWGYYWYPYLNLRVPINSNGASTIYTNVDGVRAGGGTYLVEAMNYARKYWNGNMNQRGTRYPSPIIPGATCQLNYNILISDGDWWNHNGAMGVVRDMKNRLNVKTFAVGLAIQTGNRSNYDSLADNGGTDDALYANSSGQLLTALKDAILQAISGTLTFTTPAVMSDVQKEDFIYQSTFKYSKYKQWEGYLKKYKLNKNGSFGAELWDAAKELNDTSPNSRKIWTIDIGTKSTNNFTTSNRSYLKPRLFPLKTGPTDAETDDLINFIRGYDSYDTDRDNKTTDERHKLADIYHSDLIVVSKPDASTANTGNLNFQKTDAYYRQQKDYDIFKSSNDCGGSCSSRTEVIIAGANSGILHAFDTKYGKELWGYIPPNIIGKLSSIVTTKSNATNPIYGIDGSPTVKDIYFDDTPNNGSNDPRWRTVLISGLGAGGNGYFALDITDINNPKHLFAIENDTFNKEVRHWNSDENLNSYFYGWKNNPPTNFDYSKLGASWSTPRIIRIKVNGADRWVAVFGAGYNSGVAPEYGSAIFIMDLENEGMLLKKIDIKDKRNASHSYAFSVFKGTKEFSMGQYGLHSYNYNNQKLIVAGPGGIDFGISQDENGGTASNIKIVLEQELPVNTNFEVTVVNKTDIVNSLPSDLTAITADGTDKANYDGAIIYASDLEGKVTKVNLTENFSLNNENMIDKNISTTTLFDAQADTNNGRYIYKSSEATINDDNNLWLYFGTGDTQKLQDNSSNILNRIYGIKDKDFPNFKIINTAGTISQCKTAPNCPSSTDLGWYINLKNSQKLTASVTIDNDLIHYPVYQPTTSSNSCTQGDAIYCKADAECGYKASLGKACVNLGKGVLSKIVVHKGKLYMGISGEAKTSGTGFTSKDALITGTSSSTAKKAGGKIQLEGWREIYEQFD
jgi:type IV pilus assembly protein PilY1